MAVSPLVPHSPSVTTSSGKYNARSPAVGSELTEQLNEEVRRKYVKGIVSSGFL